MNFLKSESYNLSPDEYLQKFKNPHQVISYKGSALEDEKDQAILDSILVKHYNDNNQTSQLKERIVTELSQIVDSWMHDVAEAQGQPDNFKTLGYGLKVFGSYRLKTNSHDGDIDMLCIVPEYFSREKHFFVQLAGYFRKHEHIQEIFAIRTHLITQLTPSYPSCD